MEFKVKEICDIRKCINCKKNGSWSCYYQYKSILCYFEIESTEMIRWEANTFAKGLRKLKVKFDDKMKMHV